MYKRKSLPALDHLNYATDFNAVFITPSSHGGKQKPRNAKCYDPYILLSPRPRSYIRPYKHAGIYVAITNMFLGKSIEKIYMLILNMLFTKHIPTCTYLFKINIKAW